MKWNRLIFQDKKSYFKAFFIGVLNSIFIVLGTWLFYKALENLNASQLSMSLYFLLGFIGCEIFSIFFEYYKQKLFIWLIYSTQNNLRYAFFNKLNKIHTRDFKNQANESFLNLLETDSNNVAQYALVQVTIISYITVVIGYTILYAYLAWMIILIFWATSIVKFLIQLIAIKFKAKNTVRAKALQENLFVKIGNYANNFLSFVFADKTKLIVRLFVKNINGIYIKEAKYDAISSTFGFIQNLLNWIALATCFVAGLLMYQNQIISLSLFIIFVTYFNRFDINFRALFDVFEDVKLIKEYNKKVNDFFARFQTKNLLNKVQFEKLSIENLSFKYEDKQILDNINLTIDKNKKYLISGKSGAGKSTLVELIFNLLPNYQGTIKLNDYTIQKSDDLSSNFALMNDEIILPEIIEKEYWQQSPVQDLLDNLVIDFIDFNQNTETNKLSLGQKQRLILLNTLMEDKNIYVLDESLSNIDKANQVKIFDYLVSLNKTIIFVSHHFNQQMIAKLDQVFTI